VINLAEKVDSIWRYNKGVFESKLAEWLKAIQAGEDTVSKARKQFHQWHPLKVYISVGRSNAGNKVEFSLRFSGQEVAQLLIKDEDVFLKLKKGQSEINQGYFHDFLLFDGQYPWNGKVARAFRAYFKKRFVFSRGMPSVRSIEHRIESKFIQEMFRGSDKFEGRGLEIKPVGIAGCPLQFPVPISANTGLPKSTPGHIDILARRKVKGKKVLLSVWELKKPNEYKYAASQAYIYALSLIKILRSPQGKEWYKVFGFRSSIPKTLEIEAVVAITPDMKYKFDKEMGELVRSTPLGINGDKINLHYVCYKEKTSMIELTEESLTL